MKKFAYALAAVTMLSAASVASADESDQGASILATAQNDQAIVDQAADAIVTDAAPIEQGLTDPAPVPTPDPTMTPAPRMASEIPAPVTDHSVTQTQPAPAHVHRHHTTQYYRPRKKQNFFQKWMELERKKNAWLKEKFLGL